MTATLAPQPSMPPQPPQQQRRPLSPLVIVLIVVASVMVALGIGFAAVTTLGPATVDLHYSVGAGSSVAVTVPNAPMHFHASPDGRVHVAVSGWRSGPKPTFTVRTTADATRIEGGCSRLWFTRCSISVDVSLPPTADLAVTGTNGDVTATGLDGALTIATTNGAVTLSNVNGRLDLRSVNGALRLRDASSSSVKAVTTNGAVDLRFLESPTTVEGQTINGSVTVQVPDTEAYRIVAHTVNGRVDTSEVTSSPDATRAITVNTVNGSVTVQPTTG